MSQLSGLRRSFLLLPLLGAVITAALGPAAPEGRTTASLPAGFSEEVIASGLSLPTAFTFLPDGRVLVAEKDGLVKVVKDGVVLPTPFIDIRSRVNTYLDRGLLGIAADPNFASNGYVYLYYVYEGNAAFPLRTKTARLTRVTASGDVASPSSEVIVLGSVSGVTCNDFAKGTDCIPADYYSHNGGDIEFGSDGTLWLAIGDAATPNSVNDNALRAQDLDLLAGKLLHVTTNGKGLSSNPFWNGNPDANRSKIWAYGLRNPFRFGLRPGSDIPFVGDVGWNDWEEVNVATAGANLGWPCYEGNAPQAGYEPKPVCQSLYGLGTSAVRFPLHAYPRATVVGGLFYTGSAYPAEFQGAYFFADFLQNSIRYLKVDTNNNVFSGPTGFATNADGPVDLKPGAGGDLYYLSINTGELRRIRFAGANSPPIANASGTPSSGAAPLNVTFSSSGSSDPDGDALSFHWAFGDGATSSAANPTHTYNAVGSYTTTLTVSDGRGAQATDTVPISVGNTAPTATITAPTSNLRYAVGDVISFSGSATDPEDGALPASALSWQVILEHCPAACHQHQFTTATGAGGSFTVPDHGDDSHFRLTLTATDSSGLRGTATVEIFPRTTPITLATSPSGLQVVYDGTGATSPVTHQSIVGSRHTILAPSPQGAATFRLWSDGGAQQHDIIVGTAATTYTATFDGTASGSMSFAPEADSRVHESAPTAKYTAQDLRVDGGADLDVETFLRFNVNGVGGAVQRATLRLFAYTSTLDGPRITGTTSTWPEGLTWNTRPAPIGAVAEDKGTITANTWVEFDVTPLVTGNGLVSFVLQGTSSDEVDFYSREDAGVGRAPQLVIVFGGAADTTPPSQPSGLTATASANGIALDWTDNAEPDLSGYNVYRAASPSGPYAPLNTSPLTISAYSDADAPAGQIAYYEVRAVDTSGNQSAAANASASRPAGGGGTLSFAPRADARVHESSPLASYATQDLRTDGVSPARAESYLRFQVDGLIGPVAKAALRVFAYTGTSDGPSVFATAAGWAENLTWNTRPAPSSTPRDDKGAIGAGTWVEFDVTPLIGGNGSYSFGLSQTSPDEVDYYSREDAGTGRAPQLVLTVGATSDTTPPAAPTGLTAIASTSGIALDWADNTEGDLAGYNLYRAASASGPFSKLNTTALATSAYSDAAAPVGLVSYYETRAVDRAGNESAPATANATRPADGSAGNEDLYTGFVTDAACSGCAAGLVNGELRATIMGGDDALDTAYGWHDFGGSAGLPGRISSRAIVRLAAGQTLGGPLIILQVLDGQNRLVFDISIGADRRLVFWSPPGGLRSTSISRVLAFAVPNDGVNSRTLEISALRNDSVAVLVDGADALTISGLTGATTGNPRYLRCGVIRYGTATTVEPVSVFLDGVVVRSSG